MDVQALDPAKKYLDPARFSDDAGIKTGFQRLN